MVDGPTTSQDGNNHRVTLAEIQRDLQHLIKEVQDMREESRDYRSKQEARLRHQEECTSLLKTEVARLDERQKSATGILGAATFVGSAIAAAIGSMVK